MMVRHLWLSPLFVLLALLSCHDTVPLPKVQGPPLQVPEQGEGLRARGAKDRPLEVVYASPKGQLTSPHLQLTVTFNKPMVALAQVEARAAVNPLEIQPPVEGKLRWLGSRALTLLLDQPLAGSTTYRVRVKRGARALDGSVLDKDVRWTFTTPRLVVSRSTPYAGYRWARPDQKVELFFNQPVKPRAVEQLASLVVKPPAGAKPLTVAVRARRAHHLKTPDPKGVELEPVTALPLDSQVEVRLAPGLVGEEGPEPMERPWVGSYRTYGPFIVTGLSCTGECSPDTGLRVSFSNPAPHVELHAAVRVNGKPTRKPYGNYETSTVYMDQRLAARRRYVVTLAGPVKDKFGQELEGPRRFTFTTGDYSPYARLPVTSGVLEASGPKRLPVAFRNATSATVLSKRLSAEALAGLLKNEDFLHGTDPLLPKLPGVKQQALAVTGRRNARVVQRLDLGQLVGGSGRGVLALELLSTLDREKDTQRGLIRITDLGVSAKLSPHTSLVWVTSLSGGKPVEGAAVSIWRPGDAKPKWTGKTDRHGLAVAPGAETFGAEGEELTYLFFVEKGGDESFVVSGLSDTVSPWTFGYEGTWDAGEASVLGLVFSDRGLYRPGETVQLKGLLRHQGPKSLTLPTGLVTLVVSDARGERVHEGKVQLSEFGSFHAPVRLPSAAPLGSYSVVAKLPSGGAIYGRFQVEEFKPAEFSVQVSAERKEYTRGDTLAFHGAGRYLFGAAMRGVGYRWTLDRQPAGYSPSGHPGFVFSDEVPWWEEGERGDAGFVAQGQGKLDKQGALTGTVPLKPARMRGPESYELETTVTDFSRQTGAARTAVLLHPGEFYLGAKPEETFLKAGDTLRTTVVAVTPQGKRLSGKAIKGTLFLRTWHSVRKQGMGGSHYFVTRPQETASGECALTSGARPAPCNFVIPKAGYYVLRLEGKDGRGNPLKTSFGVYVTGPDYVPWRREDESKVELLPDRKVYKLGQVARVLIKAPFVGAHALFTVESNGIHLRRPIKIEQTATWIEVPITPELVPNAFVSLLLVRGRIAPDQGKGKRTRSEEDDDPGKPAFRIGYAKLVVSQESKELKVSVKPGRPEYRPGDEVTVDLDVRDHRGKPARAELTVIAADEGVLSLVGYATPSPMNVFYAHRGLSVRTSESRLRLISRRLFGEKGGNAGGGGAGEGEADRGGVRSKFVSTPYFNPSVVTGADGRAQVRFKLPDNLTTFRIMAVAATATSEFGSAAGAVRVAKPLLMLSTLPRLLRVGDTIEAGVVVHNHTRQSGSVRVDTQVRGARLVGSSSQQVPVEEGGAGEVRFRFTATSPGEAVFRFSSTLGDHRDAVELKRPVQLPQVVEAVATFGSTDSAAAEGVVPAGGIRKDVGGLEVSLSSSALVGLRGGVEYLMDYPFECLEQTVSRMVPLVLLKELSLAYGLKSSAEVDPLVGKLIARVEQLQRWDGGFSFWPSAHQSYPWVSAYAAWGLLQAKRAGHRVSPRVLTNATRYLTQQLRTQLPKDAPEGAEGQLATVKAFASQVLVELGQKPSAYLTTGYEGRAKLPAFGKALLLSAMAKARSDQKAIATLTQELVNQVHQTARVAKVEENLGDGYAPFFHSDTRSTAMVLDALLANQPEHPLVDKLVQYLLETRKEGRWRNTQETVYALVGLHSYYQRREKGAPAFLAKVVLGERVLLEQRFSGRSLSAKQTELPMARLGGASGTLAFVKEGQGRLYYSARLRYARSVLPKEPWDEGFFVTRTYHRVPEDMSSFTWLRNKTEGEPVTKVKAGELVRVTLKIVVPQQMHFVAVEDPLPAGLEAVNFRLMNATQSLARGLSHGYASRYGGPRSDSAWWTPFYHQELRDDRVQLFADSIEPGVYTYVYLARATTAGTYVTPPAHAEQMYEPEVFGRTGTSTFTVGAR
ncbi:MAG: Ig-like domain-containing protein [Deltaproteobacteria bacterium]|nr:Ig-like domain-containing protein [Deltaproteobacteria bacterium]